MKVLVVYVDDSSECVIKLDVAEDASVKDAITRSGVLEKYPDISLEINQVGIFGEIVSLDQLLLQGDRIEIYRALKMDPMEARRLRAG